MVQHGVDHHAGNRHVEPNGKRPAGETNVPPALIALDNVVLTPHVGSATWQTRRAMADRAFGNLEAHFAGKPLLSPVP